MHGNVLGSDLIKTSNTMSNLPHKSGTLPHSPTSPTSPTVMPHSTISAQALIQSHHDRSGFLRKRGQRERLMENLKLSKHVNWRQRFVVVADGCCYIFDDELAREPLHTFSMYGYNRVFRTSSDRNQFCFVLEPSKDQIFHMKTYIFACASEDDRKLWMQAFKGAMLEANASQLNSSKDSGGDDDVFKEIEKPLFGSADSDNVNMHISDSGSEDSDDSSDYDQLDEDAPRARTSMPPNHRNVPLPPLPTEANKEIAPSMPEKSTAPPRVTRNKPLDARKRESYASPPKVKPPTAEKPQVKRLTEKDCLFDCSDREQAISILREKQVPGTFLIRKSRQGDSKVLAVMTTEDVKEYKIFIENSQVSLDKKSFFRNVDDLLENYSKAPLPNRSQTLGKAYSSHELGGHPRFS